MRGGLRLLVLCAVSFTASAQSTALTTAQTPALTPCQQCCSPGGDCSKASHGQPGTCCGAVSGRAFCCPAFTTGAKCFACNHGYRCYMGRPSSNICVNEGGVKGRSPRMQHAYEFRESSSDPMVSLAVLLITVAALFYVIHSCASQRRHLHDGYAMQPGMQPGMAVGYPAHQCAVGGYPCGGYPCAGYGGGMGSVAAGAGAGFLGGMMVSNMMDAGHHHHGGYGDYGGGYGGGDYGGGDYGGGGDFGGGGGGDFSADS